MKKILICIGLAFLLLLTTVSIVFAGVSAESTTTKVKLVCYNDRKYFNDFVGDYVYRVSFWAVAGPKISWWRGGIKFTYEADSPIAGEKIDLLTKHIMELFEKLGFITVSGTVKPSIIILVYTFDGILKYEDYLFVDNQGKILVFWKKGEPLTVTIYSKVTINLTASKIDQYVKAEWDWKVTAKDWHGNWVSRYLVFPEVEIEIPATGTYDILFVPIEGIVLIDRAGVYRLRPVPEVIIDIEGLKLVREKHPYTIYLGGGPTLVEVNTEELKTSTINAIAYGSFWHRQPLYNIVYKDGYRIVNKIDLFYDYEWEIQRTQIPS